MDGNAILDTMVLDLDLTRRHCHSEERDQSGFERDTFRAKDDASWRIRSNSLAKRP
jgi:hypothetical protein